MPAVKPLSYQSLIDLFDGKRLGVPRTVRNNTQVIAHQEDDSPIYFKVVLHGSDLAIVYCDSVRLHAGLFRSATTRNRLNDVLHPLGMEVRQVGLDERGFPAVPIWRVYKQGGTSQEFTDGMVIDYAERSL